MSGAVTTVPRRAAQRGAVAVTASTIVALFILMAIFAPVLAPHNPTTADLFRRLQPPFWLDGGELSYPLGCDSLVRDILSRIIYGARVSIFIGVVVVLLATVIGVLAGLVAGYLRGWID